MPLARPLLHGIKEMKIKPFVFFISLILCGCVATMQPKSQEALMLELDAQRAQIRMSEDDARAALAMRQSNQKMKEEAAAQAIAIQQSEQKIKEAQAAVDLAIKQERAQTINIILILVAMSVLVIAGGVFLILRRRSRTYSPNTVIQRGDKYFTPATGAGAIASSKGIIVSRPDEGAMREWAGVNRAQAENRRFGHIAINGVPLLGKGKAEPPMLSGGEPPRPMLPGPSPFSGDGDGGIDEPRVMVVQPSYESVRNPIDI